jgi:hypothetical protein
MKFGRRTGSQPSRICFRRGRGPCENGGRLAPLSKLSREVRGSDDKPVLHIWSEQYNLTRRVIAITDRSDARLVLAVERFAVLVRIAWSLCHHPGGPPGHSGTKSQRAHPSSLAGRGLLATGAPPFGAWRVSQLRLLSRRRNSRSASTGLFGCSRAAFSSGDRHFAG